MEAASGGGINDVVSGSDGKCTPPAEHEYLCTAEVGYDGPTGVGTPWGAPQAPPTVVTKAGVVDHADHGHPERDRQPQRRDSQRMRVRIRHHDLLRIERVVLAVCRGRAKAPVAVSAPRHGPDRRTPPTTSGSRRPTRAARAKARTKRSKRRRQSRPDGRDQSGLVGHPDHGDPERDRQPQRRRSQRMQVRIRHHDLLRIRPRRARPRPGRGRAPSRCRRRSRASPPNTTYHFRISATNAGGTSKGSDETFKTLPNAPTVVTKAGHVGHPDHGHPERDASTPTAAKSANASSNTAPRPPTVRARPCTPLAGVGESAGRGVGGGHGPRPPTRPTTSGSRRRTPAARAKALTKRSKRCPTPPTVVTKAATSVTQTTATLNATVNPNGGEVSECEFEYGTTTTYGNQRVTCTPSPGSGTSAGRVSATLTGLTANTTYHYRISATNAGGTSKGSDETFKTLPNAPTRRDRSGALGHPDHGDPERDREPQRRRQSANANSNTAPRPPTASAPCSSRRARARAPSRCPRAHGPHRQHHLPLQDLGDQRGRHEQRL